MWRSFTKKAFCSKGSFLTDIPFNTLTRVLQEKEFNLKDNLFKVVPPPTGPRLRPASRLYGSPATGGGQAEQEGRPEAFPPRLLHRGPGQRGREPRPQEDCGAAPGRNPHGEGAQCRAYRSQRPLSKVHEVISSHNELPIIFWAHSFLHTDLE